MRGEGPRELVPERVAQAGPLERALVELGLVQVPENLPESGLDLGERAGRLELAPERLDQASHRELARQVRPVLGLPVGSKVPGRSCLAV